MESEAYLEPSQKSMLEFLQKYLTANLLITTSFSLYLFICLLYNTRLFISPHNRPTTPTFKDGQS